MVHRSVILVKTCTSSRLTVDVILQWSDYSIRRQRYSTMGEAHHSWRTNWCRCSSSSSSSSGNLKRSVLTAALASEHMREFPHSNIKRVDQSVTSIFIQPVFRQSLPVIFHPHFVFSRTTQVSATLARTSAAIINYRRNGRTNTVDRRPNVSRRLQASTQKIRLMR